MQHFSFDKAKKFVIEAGAFLSVLIAVLAFILFEIHSFINFLW